MGLIFKTIVAFCIGWGALYAAQHYWLGAMTAEIADNSGLNLLPPVPAFPAIEVDPEKLRLAINPPVTIDTKKYERLAIESMVRQVDQQNRAALSRVPQPMSIPGLHH
jgi:hypothetical protein